MASFSPCIPMQGTALIQTLAHRLLWGCSLTAGCPKGLCCTLESQPECWSCGEENLKEAWVGDASWKWKKRECADLLQREIKQMDSIQRPNRTTAAYLCKSVSDKIVLLDFALGYLLSWLKQLQVNSHFSWGLVKNGRCFSWLEKVKCCGYAWYF